MRREAAFLIAVLGFAGAALAAEPGLPTQPNPPAAVEPPAAPPVPAAPDKPKEPKVVVCENIVATGSRLSRKRVCRTPAQIEAAANENQKAVKSILDRPRPVRSSGGE